MTAGYIYSGELLSHHVEMAFPNTCAKSFSIFLDDPVLQFSQTGYQTEGMTILMYLEFFLTLRTLLCRARVALKKQKSVKCS